MASRFEISVKEIMGETDEGLGKRVIDEMYKDDTENLSTTHSKESGGSPLDFTIFSMADLIQGKPAYGSIQDVLGNFESTLASSMSGFFGQIAESPVVNSLLPDDIHAMLTENSPNPGEDEEEDSGDGGGSTAPGNVSQTASEIISLAKNEVGYAENPPHSNNNKFAPMVGHTPGLAWCSTFISAIFKKAGHPQWQIITAGTESTLDNFMERNAVGSKPKIGALAFFLFRGGRSRGRRVNHVGIVYDWNDQYIKTVDGNAQPLWSNVLTPTGFKQMGDIRPGDAICDPDGEESKVEAVYPQGIKPIYRLTLSDGSTTYASEDHLWRIEDIFPQYKTKIQTTGELKERSTIRPRCRMQPITPPDLGSEEDITIDPYLLGVLIGDGTLSDEKIGFSSVDQEIVESVKRLLPEGMYVTYYGGKGNCDYGLYGSEHGNNPLLRQLRQLGLTGKTAPHKFIPKRYFNISAEQRLQLLRGLMDTDGDADKQNRANFTTSSEQLARDMVQLVRSLGGRTNYNVSSEKTWTSPYQPIKQTGRRAFRVYVTLRGLNPFSLERKSSRIYRDSKMWKGFAVKEIQYVGDYECQCIQVSAESGMYITDDYIPTHNTSGDNERNGGQVAKRSRPRSSVEYYAYPDFVTTGGPPSSRSGSPIGGPPSSRAGPQRG